MTSAESDIERLQLGLSETGQFVYRHITTLVGVSSAWFFASAPLITIGPTTLGAYVAIQSLHENGQVDHGVLAERLRTNGIHAMLLGALPILPALASGLYVDAYLGSGSTVSAVLAIVCAYATLYVVLLLIPAFVSLSGGAGVVEALRTGRKQLTGHPTLSLTIGILTAVTLVVTAVFTVGFVILFPALAFSLHLFLFGFDGEETRNERKTMDRTRRLNQFPTES